MKETGNTETTTVEVNSGNTGDKDKFSIEDWNGLPSEEKERQLGLLPDDSNSEDDVGLNLAEEITRREETTVNDEIFEQNEQNNDVTTIEQHLRAETEPGNNDSDDGFPKLKLDPKSFEQLKQELIQEQEQHLLEHLKPEQFTDKVHYESTVENIRKQVESYADRIIENQKKQIVKSHPMRRQMDNLKGLMGLMGIELPLEAAEALAVMAEMHVKEQPQLPGRSVSKSQAFVEGTGKKVSQAAELSQVEKEMLNKLNLSPSTYLKYR
jgi:hypothetical protein